MANTDAIIAHAEPVQPVALGGVGAAISALLSGNAAGPRRLAMKLTFASHAGAEATAVIAHGAADTSG